jgi:uncharacterized membrane protein
MGDSTQLTNLQNLGSNLNSAYSALQQGNTSNYLTTNSQSIINIVNAIKQNQTELQTIQNQLNTDYNVNQEILVKQDQLLRMQNDDLMAQLRELEIIQSNISNKDKIIEQTNLNISNNNSKITILIISIILAIIVLLGAFLYGSGKLDHNKFVILLIVISVLYLFLYIYANNVFYLKDAINSIFNRQNLNIIATTAERLAQNTVNDINSDLNQLEQNWIDNNCSCPPLAPTPEEEAPPPVYNNATSASANEIPGYFYNDGTAPPQLLVPTPNPVALNLNDMIDWVDYSANGSTQYNPTTNQTTYTDQNFYNYNNNTDPVIAMQKIISDYNSVAGGGSLVDSETYSANF